LQRGSIFVVSSTVEDIGDLDFLGYSKIGDLNYAFVVDEDVGAFDVAMDNVTSVEVSEASDDLADERPDERFSEGTVGVEHCLDGAARDVFKENVKVIGGGTGAEVLYNVGVLEVAEEGDFALEGVDHALLPSVAGTVGSW
jgi:hypothetical protein